MLGMQLDYILNRFETEALARMHTFEWRFSSDGVQYTLGSFVQFFNGSLNHPPAEWLQAPTAAPPTDPNFIQLAPVVAYGELSYGYRMTCPRDGQLHCSITDAVHVNGHSGRANQFLSSVWTYPVSVAVGALRRWSEEEAKINPHFDTNYSNIWWCFFCNNQFRLLQDRQPQSTDSLAEVFGKRLSDVGRVLVMMDDFKNSKYVTRIWCVFEMFVACEREVPCTIIVAPRTLALCKNIKTVKQLMRACKVDVENAKASMPEDEKGIKKLIAERHGSFRRVNRVVKRALLVCIAEALEGLEEDD